MDLNSSFEPDGEAALLPADATRLQDPYTLNDR